MTLDDVRHAFRLLLRHKRFSTLAIASLGLAIALNTTMYSVIDTIVNPKVAMREPERLYWLSFFGDYRGRIQASERREGIRTGLSFYEDIAGRRWRSAFLERGNRLREAMAATVTPNYFRMLGVRASAGRLLAEGDLTADTKPVVLSERMYNQLFPEAGGFEAGTIYASGTAYAVVGTLAYESDFPGQGVDMWQLPSDSALSSMPLSLVRLKPGVTYEQALGDLDVLRLRWAQTTGETGKESAFRLENAIQRPYRDWRFHYALVGAVVAVLLVACANLANLQLARGVSRARELATRVAVGATRADIIRQLLVESALLALAGLALAGVLTAWGIRLITAYVPPTIADYVTHPQVSWRLVAFAVIATMLCLGLMGLAPAIKLSRVNVNDLLKSGAGTGKTQSMRRQYGALVIVEIALALSVLCSASLLVRAAMSVFSFDAGYDQKSVVRTSINVAPAGPSDRRTRSDWAQLLIARALTVPGIRHAAVARGGSPTRHAIAVDDPGGTPKNFPAPMWGYSIVTPDYLRAMAIKIVAGRDFTPGEFAEPGVIIDQRTARLLFPGADPIGRLIKLDSAHVRAPWHRIIGVATSVNNRFSWNEYERGPVFAALSAVYVLDTGDSTRLTAPKNYRYAASFSLVVRGGDPTKIPLVLRHALSDIGAANYVGYPRTWEDLAGITRLRQKHGFMASLFMFFGILALALAALGVYAIIAHMVAQRTREFGVRIAVGAGSHDIRELVVREGNVLALGGIAIGLLLTAYTAGWLRAFLFSDYERYDSRVFAIVCVVLFGVAWLASYIPARRAMRIDPVEALRND
jgi:putative ABC transport system permease protein